MTFRFWSIVNLVIAMIFLFVTHSIPVAAPNAILGVIFAVADGYEHR